MNTNLRRSVVALATAFACLAIMASPAPAITHSISLTAGTITAIGTNGIPETIPLAVTSGVGCGSTLFLDDGTGSSFNFNVFNNNIRFTLSTSPNHYAAVMSRTASTSGTLTGTAAASHNITLRIDVYLAANTSSTATSCTQTGTRLCRLTMTLHLGGTVSTNPITTSTTASLNAPAATIAVTPPCAVPFATFNAGNASISGMSIHATS